MSEHDWRHDNGPRLPDHRMIEVRQVVQRPFAPQTTVPVPPSDEEDYGSIVRPFIVTGGRTRPVDERLRVETLVTARPSALSAPLSFERRQIAQIGQRPSSIAEIAARLGAPLGVAKVLIADLIAEGHLTVREHLGLVELRSRSMLERIREGVRAL
jgi:hypothetical protein